MNKVIVHISNVAEAPFRRGIPSSVNIEKMRVHEETIVHISIVQNHPASEAGLVHWKNKRCVFIIKIIVHISNMLKPLEGEASLPQFQNENMRVHH